MSEYKHCLPFRERLSHGQAVGQCFVNIISCTPFFSAPRSVLFPFYRGRNRSPETVSNFPKTTSRRLVFSSSKDEEAKRVMPGANQWD